ncbi:unnamed protein product [Hymenolepis diminuta]|uniref:Uncharacterized protein n=1 Tax=Hymenolepis diminuta TaxID=6216 RepID=A0A564YC56_HYMDI|nr:unnamed protein product [Hymenolepis diminuta]
MLKKLHSEQLQVAIDENPIYVARKLSKTLNASCHMTIYREVKRLKGWEIAPPPTHTICHKSKSNSVCSAAFHCVLVNSNHRIIIDSDEK